LVAAGRSAIFVFFAANSFLLAAPPVLRLLPLLPKNKHKLLSMNNLYQKTVPQPFKPIVPNQA
jgi:hypothetical protein